MANAKRRTIKESEDLKLHEIEANLKISVERYQKRQIQSLRNRNGFLENIDETETRKGLAQLISHLNISEQEKPYFIQSAGNLMQEIKKYLQKKSQEYNGSRSK